jgi:hypothetical protein
LSIALGHFETLAVRPATAESGEMRAFVNPSTDGDVASLTAIRGARSVQEP